MTLRRSLTPMGFDNQLRPDPTPVRFDYTGNVQAYAVPKGVRYLSVDCVGAGGSTTTSKSVPGKGGRVQCVLKVSPGQTLYLLVGQAGQSGAAHNAYNGGGKGSIQS